MSVYEGHGVTLHHGDCLDVLRTLPDASVDSVVTDPPYGLEFMGKEWDSFKATGSSSLMHSPKDEGREFTNASGHMWDNTKALPRFAAGTPFQRWCELWATECLRVLKPGGHLLAFGGTRTWHRLACAVEDAGFEVRDSIAWLYGCLSDDTEILTSEGWVRYDRAKEGQHALAFDTATGALAWQAIQHVHRYPYAGEMVRLHSEHTDQLLTPNHRVILDAESRLPYASDVCDLRDAMVEAERMGQADRGALLLSAVQRSAARPGVGEARAQGSGGVDRRQPGVLPGEDDRAEQPRMEGRRYRVQEARELRRSAVRASAGMGATDGPQGRVHHGAPATDGRPLRVPADQAGSHQPREPRPQGQPTGEPDPLAVEPGAQALRVGEDGGGRLLPSTGVTADVVDYAGVVWCITVPHGAFIARRNGLIFATGNSGFPKSLDVSKAIDKRANVNDETHRRIALVAEVIRTHREAKGMERSAVSLAVVGTPSGACWNWEHQQLPSAEMWPAIKRVLDIPDKFDGLIEGTRAQFIGAEREVIGERTTGLGTGRGAVAYIGDSDNRDVTAPATDAAREWQGWGTALKPAFEPVVVARKPLASPGVNVLSVVESELRERGVEGAIQWTNGPVSGAVRLDPLTSSSSTGAPPAGEISAAPAAASETPSDARPTDRSSATNMPNGATPTASTSAPTPSAGPLSCETRCSTPTAESAPAATSASGCSSPSTTSTEAAPSTARRRGARSTTRSSGSGSLTVTESFAGIATGLSGSWATVRIDRLEDGTCVWPDGLPRSTAGGQTVAANVLAWGTGALNIDGCRVTGATGLQRPERRGKGETGGWANYEQAPGQYGTPDGLGRWPANVVLDETQAEVLDEQSGTLQSGANPTRRGSDKFRDAYGDFAGQEECEAARGADSGGASRFFYVAKADASERPRLPKRSLRLRDDLTPEQVDHVRARLVEAGVQVD